MNEQSLWKPALIGGVALGILLVLPLIGQCLCCIWPIGAGVLAAYLYVKDSSIPVKLGRGIALGLLTGFIGAIVYALFSIPIQILMSGGMTFSERMRQSMEVFSNLPPEFRQAMENVAAHGSIIYVINDIFMLAVGCLFGMAGGAIGVAIFEKRKPGPPTIDVAPSVPPYEPPSSVPPPPPPPADAP
jgi:hypothetical protein